MTDQANTIIETTSFVLNPVGCTDCFWKIENGLKETPGIVDVQYDLGKVSFDISFNPQKINRERIVKKVEDMGYRLKGKHYETVGVFEAIRRAFVKSSAKKTVKKA